MKTLALLALLIPSISYATGGTTPPPVNNKTINVTPTIKAKSAAEAKAQAEANVDSRVKASGGNVTIEGGRAGARAPDILSYPTAPCRIAIGASGGWPVFAFGLNGSVLDESCEIGELSRRFKDNGNDAAAEQAMCLSEKGYKVLTALGVKCLVKPEPKLGEEKVTP